MFKIGWIFKGLIYFISEVYFDDKSEYDITSKKFDIKKVVRALLFALSIIIDGLLLYKLYVFSVKYNTLEKHCLVQTNKTVNTVKK